MDTTPTLLVGHDGSSFADAALTWALTWAERCDAAVLVIRAWTITTAPRPSTWERGFVPPLADFEAAVHDVLVRDIGPLVEAHPSVAVTTRAVHGPAANTLLDASRDAELLVVGPRGLGGFRGLVLGSVSEQCVRHSACAVVVVREGDPSATDRSSVLDSSLDG